MRKYPKPEVFAPVGPKECWHPYGLQALQPEKFISVVNAIMGGEQKLLSMGRKSSGSVRATYMTARGHD